MPIPTKQKNMPEWQHIVQKRGLDVSVVDVKDLLGSRRLDAECYRPNFIEIETNIKKHNWIYFFDCDINKFNSGKNLTQSEYGVPFLRTQNIIDIIPSESGLSFTEERKNIDFLKTGDLLFVRVGAGVGDNSVVLQNFNGTTYSDNLLRIRQGKLNPYFLSVFFSTKLIRKYFSRFFKGSAQPLISKENFQDLQIPIPSTIFQDKIAEMVQEAHRKREEGKALYKESEEILLDELGLTGWKPTNQNTAVKMSEEVRLFGRADAEFFQPKYDEILAKIENMQSDALENIVEYKKGVEPGSEAYIENGVPFARVSDVSLQSIESVDKNISYELALKYDGKYSPKSGEVLFTKDGTIGTSFVMHQDLDIVLSSAFLRLIPKVKINPEYLALVLNSIVCKLQIQRFTGGAIIAHLKPSDAMILQIPILENKIQTQIADKIQASYTSREKSKNLLEKARKAVEVFVEKDEITAEKFIRYS